jgi:hypothetical protein
LDSLQFDKNIREACSKGRIARLMDEIFGREFRKELAWDRQGCHSEFYLGVFLKIACLNNRYIYIPKG